MKKLQFNLSTTVTFGKEESVSCIIKLAIDRRLVGGKGGGEGKGKGEGEGEGGGGGWEKMQLRYKIIMSEQIPFLVFIIFFTKYQNF